MVKMTQAAEPGARPAMFGGRPEVPRSPWAVAFSLGTHLAVGSLIVWFAYRQVVTPETRGRRPLQFVHLAAPPEVPVALLMPPIPPPEPEKPEFEPPKPPEPKPEAEPVVIEEKAPEPPPTPKPEPPPPPKPEVHVGTFANAPKPAVVPPPSRQVQTTGFDSATAIAPDMKLKTAVTGAFDAGNDMAARPGTDKPKGVVMGAGFDQRAAGGGAPSGRPGAVTGGGFDAQRAPASALPARPPAVQATGFGDVKPAQPGAPTAAAKPVGTVPVEILFKPVPGYTDEARSRGIQGDVILEVEFSAAGTVRVLRVIRGLGHGLDDLAVRSAGQIRFKPALDGGRPIDVRTNLLIVFRLS
jgi:TonB family protein